MYQTIDQHTQQIVSAARALLEQHGFAVVGRFDTERTRHFAPETHPALHAGDLAVDWINLFRTTLLGSLLTGDATLVEVARRLAVSPRTLQRQLAAHNTSLRAEINRARHDLAAKLSQDGANNAVIALRLGYSDTRALRRARGRWRAARASYL